MRKTWLVWAGAGLAFGLLLGGALHLVPRQAPPAADDQSDDGAPASPRPGSGGATAPGPAASAGASPGSFSVEAEPDALPFAPGETLVYDVGWTVVNAGTVTLSVEAAAAPRSYRLAGSAQVGGALAKLYALDYQAESLIDARSLLPREAVVHQREGDRRRTRKTLFDRSQRRGYFEQVGGRKTDFEIPPDARDGLAALYALRAAPALAPGTRLHLPVCDSGRMYTVELSVGARESVETPAGTFDAHRLTPVISKAGGATEEIRATLWVTDDERRLPVRIELELPVGRFTVVLRELQDA